MQHGIAAAAAMRATVALTAAGLLGGCAWTYVAPDRTRHVIGFVYAVLPPERAGAYPAESLRTRTLGVAFTSGDAVGTSISIGYSDITLAYVRENTCVRWPLTRSLPREDP